jgi:predicted nucleotidyltransferase
VASPLTPDHPFVGAVFRAAREVYGARLVSFAVSGSVARRTARPDSDLDLLLVVERLPRGRGARLGEFDAVEKNVAGDIEALRDAGVDVELSPILRTPEEIAIPTPLLFDLTQDAAILHDRGGVLATALGDLRARLERLGARRIWEGDSWYWDLKPDYRRGEIIRL